MEIRFKYKGIETRSYTVEGYDDCGDLCNQVEKDYPEVSTDYGVVSYLTMKGKEMQEVEGHLGKKVVGTLFEAGLPLDVRASKYTYTHDTHPYAYGGVLEELAVEFIDANGWDEFTKLVHNYCDTWHLKILRDSGIYDGAPKITLYNYEYIKNYGDYYIDIKVDKETLEDKVLKKLTVKDYVQIYLPDEDSGYPMCGGIYQVYKKTASFYYLEWVNSNNKC